MIPTDIKKTLSEIESLWVQYYDATPEEKADILAKIERLEDDIEEADDTTA